MVFYIKHNYFGIINIKKEKYKNMSNRNENDIHIIHCNEYLVNNKRAIIKRYMK